MEVLKIKFENRNFKKNYLKMEVWKLNLRKWNFEELFENWILK